MKLAFYLFVFLVLAAPFIDRFSLFKISAEPDKNNFFVPAQRKTKSASTTGQMITIAVGGDVMLGRTVNTQSIKYKDFTWAFKNIAPLLGAADLSLINLETPIISPCAPTDTGMIFCAPPEHVEGLKFAGIDIVNLANNHIKNQGQAGLDYTVSILKQNGITPIGFESSIKEIKGVKFGFLGFNAVDNIDENSLITEIKNLKSQVDIIVATFHWGSEYQANSNVSQKKLGHMAVDSGADVVIGHHPHWVQEKEFYQGKLIYYSLGNLIFDQAWSEKTQQGIVVKLFFSGKTFITSQEIPLRIHDFGQPKFTDSY